VGFVRVYSNRTTAIKVSLELRENYIYIYLIRLESGRIPPYLDSPRSWAYLDSILRFKGIDLRHVQKPIGDWITPDDVEAIIGEYARALADVGDPILRGEFGDFEEAQSSILDEHHL
jgi:hypothetical protein